MPSFIKHLANTTRSYRRFRQIYPVTPELMTQWVDNARVSASAGNKQPLCYRIVTDKEQCAQIFETLTWQQLFPIGMDPNRDSAQQVTLSWQLTPKLSKENSGASMQASLPKL